MKNLQHHPKLLSAVIMIVIFFVTLALGLNIQDEIIKNSKDSANVKDSLSFTLPYSNQKFRKDMFSFESNYNLGLSVGGAKDIDNFRNNIIAGYMPLPESITYEGLYYDYYFEPGISGMTNGLFSPSYAYAVSDDPVSGKKEYYLSVGLNSNIKVSDFKRKKLNLIVVLDISGSMASAMNRYFYDGKIKVKDYENDSKIETAKETVCKLLDHLNNEDRFGFVTFEFEADIQVPLKKMSEINPDELKRKIMSIESDGGTNMEEGIKAALSEYGFKYGNFDEGNGKHFIKDDDYENRIIIITDAMPNLADYSDANFFSMINNAANHKIFTSIIGVGVDFNTQLTERITKIIGANYFSVNTSKDFRKRLGEEFEYLVTPLVFDLKMNLISNGFKIDKIYGSPEANQATGELMRVNTLFPSENKDGETKGGVILIKLKKNSESPEISLNISYKDRSGKYITDNTILNFPINVNNRFDNNGIRKAVLLARYAELLKTWLNVDRSNIVKLAEKDAAGNKNKIRSNQQHWERKSDSLYVSGYFKDKFRKFHEHFQNEMDVINDEGLRKEKDILKRLK